MSASRYRRGKPFNAIISLILLTAICMGYSQTGCAHDPGLSFADIRVLNDEIQMQFSFSDKDIGSLLTVDMNHDEIISPDEFSAVKDKLRKMVSQGIDLRINDASVSTDYIRVYPGQSETIRVILNYSFQAMDKISLSVPLISQFSRGHRLHLTVNDSDGRPQFQKILSASSAPVLINDNQVKSDYVFQEYFTQGVWHIWIGFDHILFLVTLLLPAVLVFRGRSWQSVEKLFPVFVDTLKVVSAFTLAHSVTLGLSIFDIVQLPARLIESVIAFSVLVTAVNNIWPLFSGSRWLLAFGFGLIHGFGFANVLIELGLPDQALFLSLVGFNLGVEAGQLAIVMLLIPAAYLIRHSMIYRKWIVMGGSATAAVVASAWMFERISGFEFPVI